ncbi:DUF6894 family protein [Microvirga zambiensis]|uniref:DUF6894 family protein n=1 Tax=Microvirga zambiensis TaxID=1402137 RepID=UPI003CCD255C
MSSRYYFNLTNGSHFIHDSEGCQLEDINSALAFANKAIRELRAEASLPSEVWQSWEMEICNSAGEVVWVVPLEPLHVKKCSLH